MEIRSIIRIVLSMTFGVAVYYSINGNKEVRKNARMTAFVVLTFMLLYILLQ